MEEQGQTGVTRNPNGTYPPGVSGNIDGRPADTPEKKIEKKVIAQLVEEYKEILADVLPELAPVLKEKALTGDVPAIKEIHDRIMGKSKETKDLNVNMVTPIYGGQAIQNTGHDSNEKDIPA